MSRIAQMTNNDDPFGAVADSYLPQWQAYGINSEADPPHTTLSYDDPDSHGIPSSLSIKVKQATVPSTNTSEKTGLLYNIYADALLALDFIPRSVYEMQSTFYPTVAEEHAVPLDTRHNWAKSDWAMFAAAVAGTETRDMFIGKLARWVGVTSSDRPMTDLFDSQTGGFPRDGPTFVARPVVGGFFALLALPARDGRRGGERWF